MDSIWTDDRIEQLKTLWTDGVSARAIAAEMGCFCLYPDGGRSAVIGKIHRLHLPTPTSKKNPKGVRRRREWEMSENKPRVTKGPSQRRNPSHNVLAKIATVPSDPGLPERLDSEAPDGTGIQLRDLTELTCRFPRGDPKTPDFEFCGALPFPGMPYCAEHCCTAYRPVECRDRADKALGE